MDRKTIIHLAAARSAELVPTRAVSAVRREGRSREIRSASLLSSSPR